MSKNKRKILIAGGSGILMILLLFLFRGPLRENVMSGVISQFYKGSVTKAYEESLLQITPTAKKAGLTFNNQNREIAVCNTSGYKGFGIDISCNKSTSVNQQTSSVNKAFVEKWRQNSKQLETYLLESGWQKDWNAQQPIDEIFNTPDLDTSIGVNYSKQYGHVMCELSIFYNGETDPRYSSDLGGLACFRSVHVFGYELGS